MKVSNLVFMSALLAGGAHAAVTLGFSTGTSIAEGWANASRNQNLAMSWGIIVDGAGDGFDGFHMSSTNDGGALYSGLDTYDRTWIFRGTTGTGEIAGGQVLTIGSIATDDRIFLSANLMAIVGGQGRITKLSSMLYSGDVTAGDKYAIVWFDHPLDGSSIGAAESYGAWSKEGTLPSNGTILPTDPGSYTTQSTGPAGIFGADNTATLKTALVLGVPEPSAATLGFLGLLGLLRRRR